MRSKTSFINKTVFKKNMMLYWPLVVCYLVYGIVKVPGTLWMGIRQQASAGYAECLTGSLNLESDFYAAAVMALISGMLLFGYLFKAESANMMHALPVTRTELFFTNVFSGFFFLFVPQILVFLVTMLVSISPRSTQGQYIGIWLLSVMGVSFFLFAVVCFCAAFTGQLFALPVYFVVVNFLALGISTGVRAVISFLGYGISYSATPEVVLLRVLSPFDYLCSHVSIRAYYAVNEKGEYVVSAIRYTGGNVVLGYLFAACILYLLAWYGYKKRRLESAGDLLTFQWVKPVFRWGVGVCIGYMAAALLADFLQVVFIPVTEILFYVLVNLFAFLGFFIAEMFVQKSFRVFTRKRFQEYGLFFAFTLVSFAGLLLTSRLMEQNIPKEEQIAGAYIEMNCPVQFLGDDIRKVTDLHKELTRNKKDFRYAESLENDASVYISYRLKNGKYIYREYLLPAGLEESVRISEKIYEYEIQPENYMRYLVGSDYAEVSDITEVNIGGLDEAGGYAHTVRGEKAKRIYQALLMDIKAKTVQKYNICNFLVCPFEEWQQYPTAAMSVEFKHSDKDWKSVYDQMDTWNAGRNTEYSGGMESASEVDDKTSEYLYLDFGEDCENLIQALVAEKVIESADELDFCVDSYE